MKRRKILIPTVVIAVALLILLASFFVITDNRSNTPETIEVNKLLEQSNTQPIDSWALNTNCSETGGNKPGYLLEASNIAITLDSAAKLKSLATNQNLSVTDRADGYEIAHTAWTIIVLDKNRSDLFVSIPYQEKPESFPVASTACN